MKAIDRRRRRGGATHGRGVVLGFTLIELLITMAVLAILVTIAYASYQSFIVKSRRAAAQTCLTEAAQMMERHYTTALSYAGAAAPAGACITELGPFYNFAFVGTPDASTYVIQAAPTAAQPDTKCGTMSVNQAGVNSPSTAGCW